MKLTDKSAIITGSESGLDLAVALEFATGERTLPSPICKTRRELKLRKGWSKVREGAPSSSRPTFVKRPRSPDSSRRRSGS